MASTVNTQADSTNGGLTTLRKACDFAVFRAAGRKPALEEKKLFGIKGAKGGGFSLRQRLFKRRLSARLLETSERQVRPVRTLFTWEAEPRHRRFDVSDELGQRRRRVNSCPENSWP